MYRVENYLTNLESIVCISDIVERWKLIERRITPLTGYWSAKNKVQESKDMGLEEILDLIRKGRNR